MPARNAAMVPCVCAGVALSERSIVGRLDRYMSIATGPMAVSEPRSTTSPQGVGGLPAGDSLADVAAVMAYGLSSKPAGVEAYDIDQLTGDMVGLLDHLGVEKAIFCGHDWGGIVVWQAPLIHPSRVAGVIGLNTPFMSRAPADPIAIMRNRF